MRTAAFPFCLRLITGAGPIPKRYAPIPRRLRLPSEIRMSAGMFKRPDDITLDIGRKTQRCARFHNAGKAVEICRHNKPPFPVPFLRPGIRVVEIDRVDRAFWQRIEKRPRVFVVNPYIRQILFADGGYRLGDAVDKGFATDEPPIRVPLGHGGQMLAAAKADFKPHA